MTMHREVSEALRARVASEAVERIGPRSFVAILTLDSGTRLGLSIADGDAAEAAWAVVEGDTLTEFAPEAAIKFLEPLETPRAELDERLERSAADLGLPAEAVLFSFPVVPLVRAMLEKNRPHFARLSLMWLLPSELRELRKEIAELVHNDLLPRQLRDLAERLVVPE